MSARFDPFAGGAPRWWTISARRPFLEDLAAGVLDWLGDAPPESLSDAVILTPNRRAARAFAEALSRLGKGRPLLLPQVRPLGDLEEDEPPFAPGDVGIDLPPAIAPLTRRFELARLISEDLADAFEHPPTPTRALDLADALGRFFDSCQLEEIADLSGIKDLVEGDLAAHWQASSQLLCRAVELWPERLKTMGLMDSADRRAKLLRLLAEQWRDAPPQGPVIAAGSTGSAPAAADVLDAVANAPRGCVVLPGLDLDLDDAVWRGLKDEEQHPQNALFRLLTRHGVERSSVRRWFEPPAPEPERVRGEARERLLNEALRPADATGDWRKVIQGFRAASAPVRSADPIALGLEGMKVLTLRHEEDAAASIALMMRETLEQVGPDGAPRTCALVTPDQALGRRVQARLERWGIVPDVSGGRPLLSMEAGVLVDLAARWLAEPLKPQTILGLLKHPRAAIDLGDIETDRAARALEALALRGPRSPSWERLEAKLAKAAEPTDDAEADLRRQTRIADARALAAWLQATVEAGRAPFAGGRIGLKTAACALVELVERLAGEQAWAGPDGEAASELMVGLIEGGPSLGEVSAGDLATLVNGLLAETVVRTGGATPPSLHILGAIEARLVRSDRMILAGLEDGVWPQAPTTDPFLSRPMRETLGLPPLERRLGQTAQDFVQAACADEAILIHVERRGGQPAVRSRWLWRLDMLTRGAHTEGAPVHVDRASGTVEIARALDAPPPGPPRYAARPQPRPPVARRPRKLPVTSIERWVRDPYAIYASRILGLRQLERPGASAEALARGSAIHKAVERAALTWPDALPDDCADQIEGFLKEALGDHGFEDHAMAREAPLARNCAVWLNEWERERRARGVELLVEREGSLRFMAPGGEFVLTAKADRIEIDAHGGAVIDFKTGSTPSAKAVAAGFAPQLTLTGAILAAGGFEGVPPVKPSELLYVRLTGRATPGEVIAAAKVTSNQPLDAMVLSERELERLRAAVAKYDLEDTPYRSWEAPQFMGNFGGNYDHLARVWEWHVVGADDEAGDANGGGE